MLVECPFSCRTCHVEFREECHRDPGMRPAARSGTIDATLREASRGYPRYRPRALCREPWILQFDTFLEPWEADRLLETAGRGFERSLAGNRVSGLRTSSQSWCRGGACLADPLVQLVRRRVSNLTKVPPGRMEHLQLLRYLPGQSYGEHHDQNSARHSAWGPRLYTFFMYLSDVEAGGETRFTRLNVTVRPKKGRAILWPSVLSHDPFKTDARTHHEAAAVQRGVKYAANLWLHMFDFQGAVRRGCEQREYFQDSMWADLWPQVPEPDA